MTSYLLVVNCARAQSVNDRSLDQARALSLCRRYAMNDRMPLILLIEEDPTLLEITAFRLELLGYQVAKVESAEDGLDWLSEQLPDVMIVDQYLPGIDGLELLNRLSNDMRTCEVPIILLSPNADLDDVQKAFHAGANDYLVIPFDPVVLEHKVERFVNSVEETVPE